MKRAVRLSRLIRLWEIFIFVCALSAVVNLTGCGKAHEQQHGTLFPNGPTLDCTDGPDAQTANMPVGIVVSEHCKKF